MTNGGWWWWIEAAVAYMVEIPLGGGKKSLDISHP
jgi:hypothetical protein